MDDLKWVDALTITSIVDNFVDLLLQNEGPARRRPRQAKAFARCLCAEHGLAEFAPEVIVPMHCTGLATIEALQQRLPGRVIYNSAGTQYTLTGAHP